MIPPERSYDAEQLLTALANRLKKNHEQHLGDMHDSEICTYCRTIRASYAFLAEVRDKDIDVKASALKAFVLAAGAVDKLDQFEKAQLFLGIDIGTDGRFMRRPDYQPEFGLTDQAYRAGRKAYNEVFEQAGIKPSPVTSPLPDATFS